MLKIKMGNFENINSAVKLLSDQVSVGSLSHCNQKGDPYPSGEELSKIVDLCYAIFFPGFFGDNTSVNSDTIQYHIGVNVEKLYIKLSEQLYAGMCFDPENDKCGGDLKQEAQAMASEFVGTLPGIREILSTDVEAIFRGDPAAKNYGEIILAYPGLKAIVNYRIAHSLLLLGANPLIPRMITEKAHSLTGIDIHPGATIGRYFAIDHGTGIVIGETTIIGENVKLYQGVTLGARSFPADENNIIIKGILRHPIIEDNVVIYAGATILGRVTIGHDSVVGANTWVTTDLPAGSKVTI